MKSKPLIIIGSGGHARVLGDVLLGLDRDIIGFTSDQLPSGSIDGIRIIGNDEKVLVYKSNEVELVNGIGSIPGNQNKRIEISKRFREEGYVFSNVISKEAILSKDISIGKGVQIMPGVVIQRGVSIGMDTIINTASTIDHDCSIGSNCHISPKSILCGSVTCENNVHIGAGSSVIQGILIGEKSVVAAGSIIYKDVSANTVIMNDLKVIEKKKEIEN